VGDADARPVDDGPEERPADGDVPNEETTSVADGDGDDDSDDESDSEAGGDAADEDVGTAPREGRRCASN
jgi:magnesium chelatase subunit D